MFEGKDLSATQPFLDELHGDDEEQKSRPSSEEDWKIGSQWPGFKSKGSFRLPHSYFLLFHFILLVIYSATFVWLVKRNDGFAPNLIPRKAPASRPPASTCLT